MLKKYLAIVGVASFYLVQAQDVSVIQNSVDVYSSTNTFGTSKYNAMAGAMGALGGDISVMNTNPAGIGVVITHDISGTISVLNNRNTSNFAGNSFAYKTKDTSLANIGGVSTFEVGGNSRIKFVNIGISYSSSSIENYIETRGNSGIAYNLDTSGTEYVSLRRHAYDRVGDMSKTSIGVGANLDNKWYFGTGINMHSASINQKDFAEMEKNTDNTLHYFHKQYTPYTEEASGFSMNFGVIGRLTNEFRFGAALETPTWWRIDRAFNYYDVAGNDDGIYSEVRDFSSPMKTTLSAAYVPNKNFAFNIDYIVGLTKPKYSTKSKEVDEEFKDFYKQNFKNLSEIRVGAEYRYQGLRARAGYSYASNPFDKMTINAFNNDGSFSDKTLNNLYGGERNTLGLGLGYDFKAFYIDVAYQNISSKYKTSFLYGNEVAGSQYFSTQNYIHGDASAVTEIKNNKNIFTFTAGWKF